MERREREDESIGICVIRRQNEDIDSLLKRFKKKVSKSGIQRDLKLKMQYEKPSVKKRRKRAENLRRMLRDQSKFMRNSKPFKSKKENFNEKSNSNR